MCIAARDAVAGCTVSDRRNGVLLDLERLHAQSREIEAQHGVGTALTGSRAGIQSEFNQANSECCTIVNCRS